MIKFIKNLIEDATSEISTAVEETKVNFAIWVISRTPLHVNLEFAIIEMLLVWNHPNDIKRRVDEVQHAVQNGETFLV